MISGATRGAGGAALAAYMAAMGANEVIRPLEGRGLTALDSREQVEELTRMGSHARTSQPLYHLHADPPPGRPWTPEERAEYWRRTEAELGLEGRPFAAVMHIKAGREHEHRVYLRVHADGTAIRLDHDYARREKVGRIFEHDRGEPLVKGAHNRAVIVALDRERPDVAAAMRAAGLHEGPPARAPETPGQRTVRERREVKAVRGTLAARVLAAWKASDGQAGFVAALAEGGLELARGDKKAVPMIIDDKGKPCELGRLFAAHVKATKEPVPDMAAVSARIDVAVLPSVAEAQAAQRAASAAPPEPAIDVVAPVHDHEAAAPVPVAGAAAPVPGQPPAAPAPQAPAPVAATSAEATSSTGSWDGTQAASGTMAKPAGGGGGGVATASGGDAGGGVGASLGDAGDGPGEPPGPGASPDERARWLAKLGAWKDRKAALWAAWVKAWDASTKKGGGSAAPVAGGGQDHAVVQRQAAEAARAVEALLGQLREQWDRARSGADLRAAIERFEADAAATAPGPAAGHGDDRAASGGGAPDGRHDNPDARTGGGGRVPAHGPYIPTGGGTAVRGGGPGAGCGVDRGEPGAHGGQARQALAAAAATARLARALAAVPEPAMERLRRATAALRPGAAAAARVRADRARIAGILAGHPHPDPAERNAEAREAAEERAARREHTARTVADAASAEADARAAFVRRGPFTWLRNVALGSLTPEQRRLLDAAEYADRNRNTRPDDGTLQAARERGRLYALAARDRTAGWEGREEVAEAMEQARLNALVDAAARAGDPQVGRAIEAGDPEAARRVIQAREEVDSRMGMQPPGIPAPPGTGGHRGPR